MVEVSCPDLETENAELRAENARLRAKLYDLEEDLDPKGERFLRRPQATFDAREFCYRPVLGTTDEYLVAGAAALAALASGAVVAEPLDDHGEGEG